MSFLKNVGIGLVVVFIFFSLIKNIFDYQKKLLFFQEFKKEAKSEQDKNTALKTAVLKSSDINKIEKTIRDKLSLSRKGEEVVILARPTPTPIMLTPTPAPVWRQWWGVFFTN